MGEAITSAPRLDGVEGQALSMSRMTFAEARRMVLFTTADIIGLLAVAVFLVLRGAVGKTQHRSWELPRLA